MDQTVQASTARERLIGTVLVMTSAALFGIVDGLSKVLVTIASPAQVVWGRYAIALVFLLVIRAATGGLRELFVTRQPRLQVTRGLMPLVVSFGMVLGVQHLPLAETTTILFAAPLLIVALSGPVLGEHVHRASWIAVGIGFLGVLVVARPGFSLLSQFAIFPLVAAVFYAFLQLLTRKLSAAGEKPFATLAWTLVTGSIATTPFVFFFWQPLDLSGWLLMLALGAAFALSQLTIIAGLARAPVALAAPLNYVQIVSAVSFGLIVFHEVPDGWTLTGIALIVGAGLYVVTKRRQA
jgi:drug/metabolite transporter (DMT)-like permease